MAELAENDDTLKTLEEVLKNQDPTKKMPTTKEILNMVDDANVPEEMKENLRAMLTGNVPQVFGGYGSYLAVVFVMLIFCIICKWLLSLPVMEQLFVHKTILTDLIRDMNEN